MLPQITDYFKKPQNKVIPVQIYPEFDYKLMFDGCSRGNPGISGAGAVIYHLDDEIWCESAFVGTNTTNNCAEYTGLILGLEQAKTLNIKQLKVEGDSLLVINQMKGIYKCKSDNLFILYEQAKKLTSHFEKIEFVHILRNKNKRADELSNIGADKYIR